MSARPLDQLNSVAVGISKPRSLGAVRATGPLELAGRQACSGQRIDGLRQVVYLDGDMTESGTDLDRSGGWPMDQLQSDHLVVGELEHGQARAISEVYATDLAISECRIEVQRGDEVGNPISRMECPHDSAVWGALLPTRCAT